MKNSKIHFAFHTGIVLGNYLQKSPQDMNKYTTTTSNSIRLKNCINNNVKSRRCSLSTDWLISLTYEKIIVEERQWTV